MISKILLISIGLVSVVMATPAQGIERADVERVIASIRGNTIIVDWHGTWDYDTIQPALDAADDGDTIIVLPSPPAGAYVENITFPAKAITLRSIHPQDPAIVAATIIDGGHAGSVVTLAPGTPRDAAIDGFFITHGYALVGGGIHCCDASPTIIRCVVENNDAVERGGGIFCGDGGTPTIRSCVLRSNPGGGLACVESSPTVVDCIFEYN